MRSFRTDLAIEMTDSVRKKLDGVIVEEEKIGVLKISKVEIQTKAAGEKFGKPIGIYYTIALPHLKNLSWLTDNELDIVAQKISQFLKSNEGLVLVAGLGNRDITPDSLGPRTISKILSTRHMKEDKEFFCQFEGIRSVAAIAPGVLGQTGIEISEIIKSVSEKIRPISVIVVDALVSRNIKNLGTTIQISNSGISPGSGVMNPRKEISQTLLGVPIISIGIPTVVDAKNLMEEIDDSSNGDFAEPMIVTPKEIDNIIKNASTMLGLVINKALQSSLSIEEIKSLIS